jgi:hypothetical protein
MEQYNNYSGFTPPPSSPIPTDTGSKSGSSFSWSTLGGNLLSGGLNFFSSQENRKGLQAQADALKSKGYSDVEVARLMLEGKKLDLQTALAGGNKVSSGGNTTLYIALGVGGVLVLGLIIFAVTRKKAQ